MIEWLSLRLAVLIYLDIELPALSAEMTCHTPGIDLALDPSMTEKRSGYHRVFDRAKARAIELQTTVCVVGCIGSIRPRPCPNFSGAAVYLPCEKALGGNGRFAPLGGATATTGEGPLLVTLGIPAGALRRIRGGEADVWPNS